MSKRWSRAEWIKLFFFSSLFHGLSIHLANQPADQLGSCCYSLKPSTRCSIQVSSIGRDLAKRTTTTTAGFSRSRSFHSNFRSWPGPSPESSENIFVLTSVGRTPRLIKNIQRPSWNGLRFCRIILFSLSSLSCEREDKFARVIIETFATGPTLWIWVGLA